MYHWPDMPPEIRKRHNVECRIVRRTVRDLIAAGYQLAVNDGGDELACKRTGKSKALMAALINTDEDYLIVYRADASSKTGWSRTGWVRFVYGNDGWDVICDYTTNLDPLLQGICDWADKTYCK